MGTFHEKVPCWHMGHPAWGIDINAVKLLHHP
jgi:hypothetical protein